MTDVHRPIGISCVHYTHRLLVISRMVTNISFQPLSIFLPAGARNYSVYFASCG